MSSNPRKLLIRRLRFDSLEERKLLAGVDVFLFDDVDGSGSFNASTDSPLRDKAVYVDLNRDGVLNSGEPWTNTDIDGIARFQNLEAGQVSIRLLGSNNRVVQTLPTAPAASGTWRDHSGTVLKVETDGGTWSINGNRLIRSGSDLQLNASVDLDNPIVDVVFDDVGARAFALTRSASGAQSLWRVSTSGLVSKQRLDVDVDKASRAVLINGDLFVQEGDKLSRIIANSLSQAVQKQPITGITIDANAVSKQVSANRFATLEVSNSINRITVYSIENNEASVVGKRSFASDVLAWEVSPDGQNIAVSTKDDFLVLEIGVGLPTKQILPDAVAPILFDPTQALLLTGSKSTPNQLIGWKTSDWTNSLVIPIEGSDSLAGTSLLIDRFGRFLVASRAGRIYQHDLAEAVLVNAYVLARGSAQVQIGLRLTGPNTAPILATPSVQLGTEDKRLQWSGAFLGGASQDAENDSLVYVVRSLPSIGSIEWRSDGSASYTPYQDANGSDAIIVQAYDGWAWSLPQTVTIRVAAVDDAPTGINVGGFGFSERQSGAVVGSISVADVDQGEKYSFSVSDPRFSVSRGVLSLKTGTSLVFSEPGYVDLTIIATSDRTGLQIQSSSRLGIFRDRTPFHNDLNPYDVDGDGVLSPLDPLIIINRINTGGIGPLRPIGEGEGPEPSIDVDGDGSISPIDILILINRLNRGIDNTESEGGEGDNGEGDSGMPSAEGEYVSNGRNSSLTPEPKPGNALLTAPVPYGPQVPVLQPQAADQSLVLYLEDLSNETILGRSRRR
jgi:hypothetical protein